MFFPFNQQAQTNSQYEKKNIGQNLSKIGALYDFYGRKNLGRQSSGIQLTRLQEAFKAVSPWDASIVFLVQIRSDS